MLATQLADAGYKVTEAVDGSTALGLLREGMACDLLVSDLAMAGIDGVTLIREARCARPGLPAILVTGYAGDAAALAVGQRIDGSFTLLRKPVTGDATGRPGGGAGRATARGMKEGWGGIGIPSPNPTIAFYRLGTRRTANIDSEK